MRDFVPNFSSLAKPAQGLQITIRFFLSRSFEARKLSPNPSKLCSVNNPLMSCVILSASDSKRARICVDDLDDEDAEPDVSDSASPPPGNASSLAAVATSSSPSLSPRTTSATPPPPQPPPPPPPLPPPPHANSTPSPSPPPSDDPAAPENLSLPKKETISPPPPPPPPYHQLLYQPAAYPQFPYQYQVRTHDFHF